MSVLPERIGAREVFGLAWPVVISMMSWNALSVVDAIFVAQLGTQALAAVGIGIVVVSLVAAFPRGLIGGVRVAVAQRTGQGEHDEAHRIAWQGIWLAWLFGLAVLPLAALAIPATAVFGLTPEAARMAGGFVEARVAGLFLAFLTFALTAGCQGRGDTRTPMVATLLANGLNIGLDPVLIHGWGPAPALGVAGAAWATVAAYGLNATVLIVALWARIRPFRMGISWERLRCIAHFGGPVGTSQLLDVFAWAMFTVILTRAGELEVAAHVVAIRIILLGVLPAHALGEAASVLVGQAVGAGRPVAAKEAWWVATAMGMGVMGAAGLAYVLVPGRLVSVFGAEPAVAELVTQLLLIAAGFQLVDAIATVGVSALTGAGDARFVMVAALTSVWLVDLPLAWFLAIDQGWGAVGAWTAMAAEFTVLALLIGLRVRSGRWLQHVPA